MVCCGWLLNVWCTVEACVNINLLDPFGEFLCLKSMSISVNLNNGPAVKLHLITHFLLHLGRVFCTLPYRVTPTLTLLLVCMTGEGDYCAFIFV